MSASWNSRIRDSEQSIITDCLDLGTQSHRTLRSVSVCERSRQTNPRIVKLQDFRYTLEEFQGWGQGAGVLACRLHSWPSCVCAFALTGTHTYEHSLGDLAYIWTTHSSLIIPTPSGAADIFFCLSSLLFLPSLQIPTSFSPKGSFTFIFQITRCPNSPCLCLAAQAYE